MLYRYRKYSLSDKGGEKVFNSNVSGHSDVCKKVFDILWRTVELQLFLVKWRHLLVREDTKLTQMGINGLKIHIILSFKDNFIIPDLNDLGHRDHIAL